MALSKAWQWSKDNRPVWLTPCEESHYLAARWRGRGYRTLLDLGSGLGRHSIFFAGQGFDVSAFDLSEEGVLHLRDWAMHEGLNIEVQCADMLHIPYADRSFDCVFAFHVISHTDTNGIREIFSELKRVLRPGGEFFLTLCSKETWAFRDAGFPMLDANTVIKNDGGAEDGIPHFYASLDDVVELLANFTLVRIRHIDDCWFDGRKQNSKHYYVLGGYGGK